MKEFVRSICRWSVLLIAELVFAHYAPTESELQRRKAEKNGEALNLMNSETSMKQRKIPWDSLVNQVGGAPESRSRHLGLNLSLST